jgi:hypothetical protein
VIEKRRVFEILNEAGQAGYTAICSAGKFHAEIRPRVARPPLEQRLLPGIWIERDCLG